MAGSIFNDKVCCPHRRRTDKTAFFNEAGLEQHLFILQDPSRNRDLYVTQRGPAEEAEFARGRVCWRCLPWETEKKLKCMITSSRRLCLIVFIRVCVCICLCRCLWYGRN